MAEAYKKVPRKALGKTFSEIIQQNMDFDNPPVMSNFDVQRLLKISSSHLSKLKSTGTLEAVGKKGSTRKSVQKLVGIDDLEHIILIKINEYGALIKKSDNYVREHIEQGYIRCCDVGTNETNKHYWRVVLYESEYLGLMQKENGIDAIIPEETEQDDDLISMLESNVHKKKRKGGVIYPMCDVRISAGEKKGKEKIHFYFNGKAKELFSDKYILISVVSNLDKIAIKITDDEFKGYKVSGDSKTSKKKRNGHLQLTPDEDDELFNFTGQYKLGKEINGWYLLEKEES